MVAVHECREQLSYNITRQHNKKLKYSTRYTAMQDGPKK